MNAIKRFLRNWWTLSVLAALLAVVLLCAVLPLVLHALDPLPRRLMVFAIIILVWGLLAIWRVLNARGAAKRIEAGLAAAQARGAEAAILEERMAGALRRLKSESGAGRRYLYDRPWYVIIGPPGAGKTTALVNSGLRFPFDVGEAQTHNSGTRNIDFLFADEAVFIDTAGRYTSQDSAEAKDREGWLRFLDLVRRNRPLQPINGVFIAIGLDVLMTSDVEAIDRHANQIRRRLTELKQGLEIDAPVYVLFTKSDLLAGFGEFFADLDVDARRSVLGWTFDSKVGVHDEAALARAFDEISQAIADRAPKRLQEELDPNRRGLILGFPAQFSGVRSAMARLIEGAFPKEAREGSSRLRGFYFTSGVQEGSPIDRLMAGITEVYQTRASRPGSSRAYFINRLLQDVVLKEPGLVQGTASASTRRAAILTGGLIALGAVTALGLVALGVGFVSAMHFQSRVREQAEQIRRTKLDGWDLSTVATDDVGRLAEAEPLLAAFRGLPGGFAESHKTGHAVHPPLYDSGLAKHADDVYLRALRRILLPRLMLRLRQELIDPSVPSPRLYRTLKAYELLGGAGGDSNWDPKAIKGWILADWQNGALGGADNESLRERLALHLDALLADPHRGDEWKEGEPLDGAAIQSAQARLRDVKLAEREYELLQEKWVGSPPWRVPAAVVDQAKAFANGGEVAGLSVPYLYTREGYQHAYQEGRASLLASLRKDAWIFGKAADYERPEAAEADLANLYAHDYETQWDRVIKTPAAADYFHDRDALNALVQTPSPWQILLLSVAKETNLRTSGAAAKLSRPLAGLAAMQGAGAGEAISDHFDGTSRFVTDGRLDQMLGDVVKAAAAFASASGSTGAADQQAANAQSMGAANAALQADSARAPPALLPFIGSITDHGSAARTGASISEMNALDSAILARCQALTRSFPFATAAKEDARPGEVRDLFGSGEGVFDKIATNLEPFLEDSRAAVWRWKTPLPPELDAGVAEQLQRARLIRDLIGPDGLRMQIAAKGFGSGVQSVTLQVGSQQHTFRPGDTEPASMRWSTSSDDGAVLTGLNQRYAEAGPWAVFRLFLDAKPKSDRSLSVRFGSSAVNYVDFRVTVADATTPNPFRDPWAFTCPSRL